MMTRIVGPAMLAAVLNSNTFAQTVYDPDLVVQEVANGLGSQFGELSTRSIGSTRTPCWS